MFILFYCLFKRKMNEEFIVNVLIIRTKLQLGFSVLVLFLSVA